MVKKLIFFSILLVLSLGVGVNAQTVTTSTSAKVTSSDGRTNNNYNWGATKKKAKKGNQVSQNKGPKAPALPSVKGDDKSTKSTKPTVGKTSGAKAKAPREPRAKAPREPRPKVAPVSKMYVEVNAINNAFSIDGLNYGLTFGKTGKIGWYASLGTNLHFSFYPNYIPSTTSPGRYYLSSGGKPQTLTLSSKTVESVASFVAGGSFNLVGPVTVYAGVGARYSETMMLTQKGSTVRNKGADLGLLVDAGFLFQFGSVIASAGAMYSPLLIIDNAGDSFGLGFKVGLGIAF